MALLVSLPAQAQQGPAPSAIERVEIRADANSQRRNDSAARTIIGREEILRYGDTSVLDVVRRAPGVTVDGSIVRMRGLGAGYTQVLVNGERMPAGFSIDTLSPEMIERIEVARSATAELSTQAIAGTINFILRKTVSQASRELKSAFAFGAGQRSPSATFSVADKNDTLSYTAGANLVFNDRDSADTGTQDTRNGSGQLIGRHESTNAYHNDSSAINLNARLNWARPDGGTLSWQTFVNAVRSDGTSSERTATPVGAPYLFPSLEVEFGIVNADARSDINWTARLAGGARLETKAGLSVFESKRHLSRLGGKPAQAPLLERAYHTDAADKGLSWSGKYATPIGAGHTFATGWDAGRNRYAERETQDDTTLAPLEAFDFDNRFRATIGRVSLYAQDEWDVTSAWSVNLGARWEQILIRTSGAGSAPSTSRSRVFSPQLHILWKIPGAKGSQVRLGLTRTYKAPELRRLVPSHFYTSINTELTPDFAGNPRLKPELARGIDAAFEHYWENGALFSVSATARALRDLIQNKVTLEGERHVSAPFNRGKAQVRVLEMELKFPLKAIMKDAPALDLRASASRNWSKVDQVSGPDNRLDRQPRWSANLGVDYRNGALSGGANLALVAGGWTRSSALESRHVTTRRELEAYGLYKVTPKAQWRVTARNLLKTGSASTARYDSRLDNSTQSEGLIGWRVQYEVKF